MITVRFRLLALPALMALAALPLPAAADDQAFTLNQSLVMPANNAIKDALKAEKAERAAKKARQDDANSPKQTAQARPVGEQEAPTYDPGLVKGFNYTLDVSAAWALGNTGFESAHMPGGVDGVLAYGFSRRVRAFGAYYQLQEYPLGFDTGTVPVYLQGLGPPITQQDLHQQQTDVTTKDKFLIGALQSLIILGKNSLPLPLPVIISPTYISRSGNVGGYGDVKTIEINGFPQQVHLRSEQLKVVAFTLPFLSSPKMFGTLTFAPQWQVSLNGANQSNHMQILKLLYLEYRASKDTTFFFQPSMAPSYLPPDPYPEHLATFIYGVAHNIAPGIFVQGIASTGTPTNVPQLGISKLTCLQLPCAPSQVAPSVGGLKATQVQVLFGIGTPSTIPL